MKKWGQKALLVYAAEERIHLKVVDENMLY
jgi:hypothetical protein